MVVVYCSYPRPSSPLPVENPVKPVNNVPQVPAVPSTVVDNLVPTREELWEEEMKYDAQQYLAEQADEEAAAHDEDDW